MTAPGLELLQLKILLREVRPAGRPPGQARRSVR